MRKIITTTFITLDGVMQAPGGPQECTSHGLKYGGWQQRWDEVDNVADQSMNEFMAVPYNRLLGKLTS